METFLLGKKWRARGSHIGSGVDFLLGGKRQALV
jgi:hypothetical protein